MHPWIVRRILLPLHEAALGRPTLRYLAALERTQGWPVDRLRALQVEKLHRVLRHAWERCPFHRRRLEEARLDPQHVTLEALTRLPTTNKAEIAANVMAMSDHSVPGGLFPYTTGGSTGRPLRFWIDRARQAADQAARARSRRWFGIEPGEREAYVWGSPIENRARDRLRYGRDWLMNHALLDAFRMTPARMNGYLDRLNRFDPVHLFGYPSSIAQLARHAARVGRRMATPSLRAVFVTGEVFDRADRAVIEEAVGVPVADGYGSREGGFIAHQCPAGGMHVTMESVIVEFLDADGRAVNEGEAGEIVVTHLDAIGMPFIRYRTGDLARRGSGRCPCGRGLETLTCIEGRRTDALRTADGGSAHALSVIYVLREEPAVAAFKVEQRADLGLDVWIEPNTGWDARCAERVSRGLATRIGGGGVTIKLVDSIPPDPSGKHRHVVSRAR